MKGVGIPHSAMNIGSKWKRLKTTSVRRDDSDFQTTLSDWIRSLWDRIRWIRQTMVGRTTMILGERKRWLTIILIDRLPYRWKVFRLEVCRLKVLPQSRFLNKIRKLAIFWQNFDEISFGFLFFNNELIVKF